MTYRLVVVESPAKAKTIEKFLPSGCKVVASMGHIIDLPASKMGVDIKNNYAPEYITIRGKGKVLSEIKKLAGKAEEVILATDPDREGEAISYHLANALSLPLNAVNRIEFHEITSGAVNDAIKHKRTIDMNLVDAQQARRVLDRLVGYSVSPVLWKKVMRGLSAGRVQSVATRLIVEKEEEINQFISTEYWNISSFLKTKTDPLVFEGKLTKIKGEKAQVKNAEEAQGIEAVLKNNPYIVKSVSQSVRKAKPNPAYTTSTLQQDANHRLGFSSKKTMMLAQQLYEGVEIKGVGHVGLVTYIRTDSIRVSDVAQASAKEYIKKSFGDKYLGSGAKAQKKTGAKVQDAHEAIRPTDINFTPSSAEKALSADQAKLYSLIYKRFLASMMSDALYNQIASDITCADCELRANGSVFTFDGYLKVYSPKDAANDTLLPKLTEGEELVLERVKSEQKFTAPPARYTEASLVKTLEEMGIGRPSTYAPTISTIVARRYVELEDKKFKPTDVGCAVTKLLVENFSDVVDYKFTADMETSLDEIASGGKEWTKIVDVFYKDLEKELEKSDQIDKIALPVEETDEVCEKCGKPMVVKNGRFGKFLACSGFPDCKFTMAINKCLEDVVCPKCGSAIVVRKSKKGRTFYGCKAYPSCDFVSWDKPTDKLCPSCGKMLFQGAGRGKSKLHCADKECGYTE